MADDLEHEPETAKQYYRRTADWLMDDMRRDSKDSDNFLFLATTGTLVLSLQAVLSLAKDFGVSQIHLLLFGWTCLLISLVCFFISFEASDKERVKTFQDLQSWKNARYDGPFIQDEKGIQTVQRLNMLTRVFLGVGIVVLFIFFSINMNSITPPKRHERPGRFSEQAAKAPNNLLQPFGKPSDPRPPMDSSNANQDNQDDG